MVFVYVGHEKMGCYCWNCMVASDSEASLVVMKVRSVNSGMKDTWMLLWWKIVWKKICAHQKVCRNATYEG